MKILCCRKASRILQILQHISDTWVWPPPFTQSVKKICFCWGWFPFSNTVISISLLVVVVPGSVVEVDVVSWHCWRILDNRPWNGNTFEERPIVVWIVGIWPFVWADNLKQHKVVRSCSQEKFYLNIFVTIRFGLIDQTVKADYPSSGSMTVPPPRTKTPAPFPFPTWAVARLLHWKWRRSITLNAQCPARGIGSIFIPRIFGFALRSPGTALFQTSEKS